MNSFGQLIRLTTFGESHGPAMGGILDGMPPMVHIDIDKLHEQIARRRPGSGANVSQRNESDIPEILSGLSADGYTLGSPIGFIVRNNDARSADYFTSADKFRPNHADYTYHAKYGITPQPGGGRASARETVSWVVAGAIVRQWLETMHISISARFVETNSVRECAAMGDSTGGIVTCKIEGLEAGIGEPVFDKLHSRLAAAMMSINAAKSFEYGDGAASAYMTGSISTDTFFVDTDGKIKCKANHSGGIQGGISNGMPIEFKVYFKPTPTIMQAVESIDINGDECIIDAKGRHDPCVAIRAVPIVEAMSALVIADMIRIKKSL